MNVANLSACASTQAYRVEAILMHRVAPQTCRVDERAIMATVEPRVVTTLSGLVDSIWCCASEQLRHPSQVAMLTAALLGDAVRSLLLPHVELPDRIHDAWDDWVALLLEAADLMLEEVGHG